MKTVHAQKPEAVMGRRKAEIGLLPSAMVFLCLSWGVLAPILGLVFIIIHAVMDMDVVFGEIGTGLMVASIPLLLAGSHFLDVWDKRRKERERSMSE